MASSSDLLVRQLAKIPEVRSKLGTFVGRVGMKAQVNVGGTSAVFPFSGTSFPSPNDPVQLELRDGEWVVTGASRPKPGEGVITGTGTPRAKVTAWGVEYELRINPAYTPVLNDQVSISWDGEGEGTIGGKLSATSAVTAPGANPGTTGQQLNPPAFTAIDSGSWNGSRWFTNDVYSSASNQGAFFYGSKIKDTIPDTAVILSARIFLPIRVINVNAPGFMRLHTNAGKPAGAPSFGSGQNEPAVSGWHVLPTSWIDWLKVNDGGIGFDHGGYWVIKGVGSDAYAGAIDATYQT